MGSLLGLKSQLLTAFLLAISAAHLSAQSPADSHARTELIADTPAAPSGGFFWVGVLFRLDQGWHIYWQNPGDSGEPPSIQWQLPSGFSAHAIRWPQPVRLMTGTIVDYGYEGQVLLMVPIADKSTMPAKQVPRVSADVKYIVCREMCIPGKAHLRLAAPPGDWARWHALFEATRRQLPRPAPAEWKISATSKDSQFILSVRGGPQLRSASFVPLEANEIDNSSPQVLASDGGGFRLTLKKSDQLLKPISTLRGLIVVGPERAYEVAAPVVPR